MKPIKCRHKESCLHCPYIEKYCPIHKSHCADVAARREGKGG